MTSGQNRKFSQQRCGGRVRRSPKKCISTFPDQLWKEAWMGPALLALRGPRTCLWVVGRNQRCQASSLGGAWWPHSVLRTHPTQGQPHQPLPDGPLQGCSEASPALLSEGGSRKLSRGGGPALVVAGVGGPMSRQTFWLRAGRLASSENKPQLGLLLCRRGMWG